MRVRVNVRVRVRVRVNVGVRPLYIVATDNNHDRYVGIVNSCLTRNGGCGLFSTCTPTGPGTNSCTCYLNYGSRNVPKDGTNCSGTSSFALYLLCIFISIRYIRNRLIIRNEIWL